MTNEEYQKSRGLDQPFNSTPEEVEAEWGRLQREWMQEPDVNRRRMMRINLERSRRRAQARLR